MTAIPQFWNLSIGAPARLAAMRTKGADWRKARSWGFNSYEAAYCTLDQGRGQWYAHTGPQFRGECFADELAFSPVDHHGWYTDGEFASETARGIVARLPHGRYLAGYFLSINGERVYYPEIFTDEKDAARMADEHARIIGESESEHAQRFHDAQRIESRIEESTRRLRECIALRHRQCMDYVRSEIADLIESIRNDRETLATEYMGIL